MSKIEQSTDVTYLIAGKSYSEHVVGKPLISVENTGNGYHITQYSYNSIEQDLHYSIDYSLAGDLRKVLNLLHKQEKRRLGK